ncbi:MAG: hypothetical protein P8O86_11030 [Actinomycetota bacterium]|nr:hypothetical protein [Actinomycetota bacterium]MDG2120813.1 hypothetical protein [Actinomycetota bacterium]
MISLCARPNTDRTHGLVSRCNKGFEVTALSSAATTGYCKSVPLVVALKTNSVREEVKELPLLLQRTYGQRRSIIYGLFQQNSSIVRDQDDCQVTGVSRGWNRTKYGIEQMIGYGESLITANRKPDLDPQTRQKVLVTLSLRAEAEKS